MSSRPAKTMPSLKRVKATRIGSHDWIPDGPSVPGAGLEEEGIGHELKIFMTDTPRKQNITKQNK